MITMTKKRVGETVTPLMRGFSFQNVFHTIKEKIKSIVREIWETQKEFDEEIKRIDAMEQQINQIVQMKVEINRSIQTITKKKKVVPKKEDLCARKTIYNEKLDISQNLRSESGAKNAILKVKELLEKSENGELSIQKVDGRQSLIPKDYDSRIQNTPSMEAVVEESVVQKQKEEDFYENLENKKETTCNNKEVSKKPLSIFECMQKIKIIDRYVQKNENSEDFKKLYYVKRMIELRQDYSFKMKQSVLLSMRQFNGKLHKYMHLIVGEEFNYVEEDIETMNRNYQFLRDLYLNYLTEEEVRTMLASIETKVNFINKNVVNKQEKGRVVKEKVA